jgi:hypothetical protein
MKVHFMTVGSPTQRHQPAPSVTFEGGTVLVNFVGFGNRLLFIFRSGRKAGSYLLASASRSERAKHSLHSDDDDAEYSLQQ